MINKSLGGLSAKKIIEKGFSKNLIKRFANIYKFSDGDIEKIILLLRKGIYPYEYMDSCKRFDETFLANKETFYSNLNMEDIPDVDYVHAKKYGKTLIIKI